MLKEEQTPESLKFGKRRLLAPVPTSYLGLASERLVARPVVEERRDGVDLDGVR